jgi:hypothetical protein
MAVLTIDPGTKTGGALTSESRPSPLVFMITVPSAWAIYRIIRWAKAWAEVRGEKLELATEGQFLARGPSANLASTLHTARAAERWIVIAELLGVPTIQITASTWQGPSFKSIPTHGPTGKKLSTKERAAILVRRLWPALDLCVGEPSDGEAWVEISTAELASDPCDAVVMGRWRMLAGRLRPRAKAPKKRVAKKAARRKVKA